MRSMLWLKTVCGETWSEERFHVEHSVTGGWAETDGVARLYSQMISDVRRQVIDGRLSLSSIDRLDVPLVRW